MDVNITDFTEEIAEGIKEAVQRALIRIGLECEGYAKMLCHVEMGSISLFGSTK